MVWIVENGRRVEGGLAPVFTFEELHVGQPIQFYWRGKLRRATITRLHRYREEYRGVLEPAPADGKRTMIYGLGDDAKARYRCSDDGLPLGDYCYGSPPGGVCVHVRFGNGVTAATDCMSYVRPLDSAVDELGRLAQ